MSVMSAVSAAPPSADAVYPRAHRLINAWQITEAEALLRSLEGVSAEGSLSEAPAAELGLPATHDLMRGRVRFMQGRYAEAVTYFDAFKMAVGEGVATEFAPLMREAYATHTTLKGMSEQLTPNGRFLIRFFEPDRALIPYLGEVLSAADRALSEDFDFTPPGPILVEIYPSPETLAAVSSLSEDDIKTSGTIALCSYNRLMFTSPRGLARGYGWRDTVSHELVHFFVTKLSNNTVPIWLHEGIAKFQEVRWQKAPGAHLAPPQEDLLARSLEANKLITFDQMHPSMAKLPSQEAAGLAFAEVHMVIDYLYKRGGYPKLRALLHALRDGAPMDGALSVAFGVNLDGLWSSWLSEMKRRGFKRYPGLVQRSLSFKRPGEGEAEPEAEYESIEQKEVRDHAHLGELLRARDRLHAALREYERAAEQGGDAHLVVQNGIAAVSLALQRPEGVPKALERVRSYYPTHLTTYLHLGEAYMALNELERAVEAFEEAVGINPFHPTPHLALAKLYTTLGQPELAAREERVLEMMR
jgi:tetratricopeptide (TPR) repeat protein